MTLRRNKKIKQTLRAVDFILISLLNVGEILLESFFDSGSLYSRKSLMQGLKRMENSNLVMVKRLEDGFLIKLTKQGELKAVFSKIKNSPQEKWDGKWRLIIFDIPESKKKDRDFIRFKLKELNCKLLQQSVWITPYKIENEFRTLLKNLGLIKYVNFCLIEEIDCGDILIDRFGL